MRTSSRTRRAGLLAAAITILATAFAPAAAAATPSTFVVTTAADLPGSDCAAVCSLRQAIGAANANTAAPDTIEFALAGGPADIEVTTALPAITDAVIIDGTTQPGIRIVGTSLTGTEDGLVVQASATMIRGLEIRDFPGHGILLDGVHDTVVGGDTAADGNVITRNRLDGIAVIGDATAVNNRITANRIFDNGALSIDLGDDDNFGVWPIGSQAPPWIAYQPAGPVNQVDWSVQARTGITSARVDVFWSAACPIGIGFDRESPLWGLSLPQGEAFQGSIEITLTTGAFASQGNATFSLPSPRTSGYLTATTTTLDGTSEMSNCEFIQTPTDLAITGTATPGGPIDVGEPVTLNVVVSNLGPLRHDAVLVLVGIQGPFYGPFQSFASGQGECLDVGGFPFTGLACLVGGLDPGQSIAITATFVPTVAGAWRAELLFPGNADADPVQDNNQASIPWVTVADGQVTGSVPSGGSLTTDTELPMDGATNLDPIETTVTLPSGAAGSVTIAKKPSDTTPPPVGYGFAGQAVVITAVANPAATAANPFVFTFLVDASIAPPDPIVVFRNGVSVPDCSVANPLTDPSATPNPCVVSRLPAGDDVAITVRTSAASTWRIGYRLFAFDGFFAPVDNGGVLNRVKAGSAVPVKFSLGGDRGLAIFATGNPGSAGISCDGARVDAIEETSTAGSSSLSYAAGSDRYTYVWKTDKAWAGTCRKLQVTFTDGSTEDALFDFRR